MKKIMIFLLLGCFFFTSCNINDSSVSSGNSSKTASKDQSTNQDDSADDIPDEPNAVEDIDSEDDSSHEEDIDSEDDSSHEEDAEESSDPPSTIPGKLTGSHSVEKQLDDNLDIDSSKNLIASQQGAYDKEAVEMRKAILKTSDNLKIKGTKYYISNSGDDWNDGESVETAWETVDALSTNSYKIKEGDAILFERGGVFRLNNTINITKSGITYSAYGEGEKPRIYGSAHNYAEGKRWEPSTKKNIWKMKFTDSDVGIIVFNHGEAAGFMKFGLMAMTQNNDYYYSIGESLLYLYSDKGSPDKIYQSIEIGSNRRIFAGWGGRNDIVIDNLSLKYTGSHAIDFYENNDNIKITNCEIGWIGGSVQHSFVRYGNGIQFFGSSSNVVVENNWIYQCYDAAVTFQNSVNSAQAIEKGIGKFENIRFSGNLLEYANYLFEFFSATYEGTTLGVGHMKNIYVNDNIMRFAGYEWSNSQRRGDTTSFITGWRRVYNIINFNIKNNIFDCSTNQFVFWETGGVVQTGLNISENTYFMKKNATGRAMHFGVDEGLNVFASNQSQLEVAVAYFDSSPKLVKWLG